ncbi:hypothetical protein HNY73_016052 [Argiope bruennichi]|uniref:Ciliary microtubule inner protein 2A-C-like domain-containing protein n=1 Tax=Argiope bruennichi TaxID=94029 RepID=A0A8T0EHN0_ARGBR|nr:hypothetical protein HNY73_016052 [Argiope bruennichi]
MSDCRNPCTHLRVPEPHFIPGYTGFCPDLVDKIGVTYPWATYAVMAEQPDIAMRLSPIKPPKLQYAFQRRNWQPMARGGRMTSTRQGICGCSTHSAKKRSDHIHIDCSGDKGDMPQMMNEFFKTQKHIFSKIIGDIERQAREKRGKDHHYQDHHRHHPCCSSLETYQKTHC